MSIVMTGGGTGGHLVIIKAVKEHLRTEERTCFLLRSLGGYSYQEIASITEIPQATVMTHLARGRAKLRRTLLHYALENGYVPKSKIDTSESHKGDDR